MYAKAFDLTVRRSQEQAKAGQEVGHTASIIKYAAAKMNQTMYMLSIVAAVFLPLSFITGLLGINVGGIPGAETGWAFLAICAGLLVLLVAEIWFLRRWHWLD